MFPPVFPFRAAGPAGGGGGVWGRAPAPNWPRGGLRPPLWRFPSLRGGPQARRGNPLFPQRDTDSHGPFGASE